MVILMATLFWALWDEAFGQRPWKAFQSEWKDRYIAFLKTAKSKSAQSEKQVEQNSDYQQLEQAYEQAYNAAQPHRDELHKEITDLNAKILAAQNDFTDRRAYANSPPNEIETETTATINKRKQQNQPKYKT